ncbi:MAG: hypothetical protein NTY05_15935, partial [Rhodocyclales bacterium]|nr:hypothetical protein [Rhodocyclales bacterium]
AALQGHFLRNTMEFLNYTDSPAVMDVYTPCQPEHGIADDASDSHARLAVRSRMNPVFVHDPRRGNTLHDWFNLEGNPDPEKTWTTMSLEYKDGEGKLKKLQMTLTPAHFALGENRFKKHFRRLDETDDDVVPIEDFINLSKADRKGRTAYIWTTDTNQHLVRLSVSGVVIELVEERRKYWQMLQYLGGQNIAARDAAHRASMEAIQAEYRKLVESRDSTLDLIAHAMSELGAGKAPVTAAASVDVEPLVTYAIEDRPKCTNCKICYQDLSELFEKTRIEVDGISKDVGQLIPGVLDRVDATPDLKLRIRRVAASCEGGIIR